MMTDRSDAIREMLDLAREIKEGGATNSSLKTKLSFFKTKVGLSDAVFDRIVDLIEKTDLPEEEKMQTFSISIWEYEKLESIEDLEIKKLCAVLMYFVRTNWHSTGWIRYDEAKVMSLCEIKNYGSFIDVVQRACAAGLLSFRVVGSKNPIICFKLDFVEEDLNSQVPWELPDLFVALGVS